MTREKLIAEIKRVAAESGRAPGRQQFERLTGVKIADWYPHIWLRWADALSDAGQRPNKFQGRLPDETILAKYADLILEKGRIPVVGEVRRKAREDNAFPSHSVFARFGGKPRLVQAVRDYCEGRSNYERAFEICVSFLAPCTPSANGRRGFAAATKIQTGFVYLMRSGKHFKIGRTSSLGRRESELRIQIPIPPTTVHKIETDDPAGVEAYWHNRFTDRRGAGEWFQLTPEDVEAFKRWRKIV